MVAHSPLVASTTRIMRSMICAPPMMVRISEAWPGQSTSVNCTVPYPASRNSGGAGTCGRVGGRSAAGSALCRALRRPAARLLPRLPCAPRRTRSLGPE
jgi:hypothetical protein